MDKIYFVTCRTFDENGEFMNSNEITVSVPEKVWSDPDESKLSAYLLSEVTGEMSERCSEEDGEYSWDMTDWEEADKRKE